MVTSGRPEVFALLPQTAVAVEERMRRDQSRRIEAAEVAAPTKIWRVPHEQLLYTNNE
jgi:hypothetical protein